MEKTVRLPDRRRGPGLPSPGTNSILSALRPLRTRVCLAVNVSIMFTADAIRARPCFEWPCPACWAGSGRSGRGPKSNARSSFPTGSWDARICNSGLRLLSWGSKRTTAT